MAADPAQDPGRGKPLQISFSTASSYYPSDELAQTRSLPPLGDIESSAQRGTPGQGFGQGAGGGPRVLFQVFFFRIEGGAKRGGGPEGEGGGNGPLGGG